MSRPITNIVLFCSSLLLVVLTAAAAAGSDGHETRSVVFDPALPGDSAPTTTIPSNAADVDPRYDQLAEDAADQQPLTRNGSIPLPLPLPDAPVELGPPRGAESSRVFYPQLAEGSTQGIAAASSNYQSDRAWMSPTPLSGVYNVDYWYWLGLPTNIDPINCDNSTDCFWFVADQLDTSTSGVALHVGPYHGRGQAGNSNGKWLINVSGYDNGAYSGGLTSLESPSATWVRLRVWRLSTSGGSATWGVWAYFNGTDRYAGSITFRGTTLTNALLFTEVYETNGPCTTDFERVYFDNPVYRSYSGGPFSFTDGEADYQSTCSDTTWEQISGDFVRDERMKVRVIDQGQMIW